MKLCLVAGARPNFMKVAPLIRAIKQHRSLHYSLVHTGQHYDRAMSDVFFEELGIPAPQINLGAGGGTHAAQTAKVMLEFEAYLSCSRPDWVLVVGDVNSTLACALTAKKMGIKVAHVEAGLRSGDMRMPEEINRRLTDAVADLHFVTEPSGEANLRQEGHRGESIHFVGNVMIDNLMFQLEQLKISSSVYGENSALPNSQLKGTSRYGVVTLHRPSNVDSEAVLRRIIDALSEFSRELPLVFSVHPRTAQRIEQFGISLAQQVHCIGPLPYRAFLNLWMKGAVVFTDSGGLQEETTALGVPCVTIRDSTERPITITNGSNILAGTSTQGILAAARRAMASVPKLQKRPQHWDGLAATRVAGVFDQLASGSESAVTAPLSRVC